MALPRIQASIVRQLARMSLLEQEVVDRLLQTEEELSVGALERALIEKHQLNEFQILVAKAWAFELPPFNARGFRVAEQTFAQLDKEFCQENRVLPIGRAGSHFVIALADPFNLRLINLVQETVKMRVSTLLALENDLIAALDEKPQAEAPKGFGDVVDALAEQFAPEEVDEAAQEGDGSEEESAPIIQLANRIVEEAYFSGGSDIHIEPQEKDCRIRVRVDGQLTEKLRVPLKVAASLIARLKVMANLDIAEKRMPQDGRIVYKQFNKRGVDIDLRVASSPLNHGEGMVMRILDKQRSTLPLPALGFEEDNLERYRKVIRKPYGMVLHCGPTGSGKSMTLYSALNEINDLSRCIRTAEDPIEYTLPGLLQMQVNPRIGLTFARALRAFLRQDPDVILVGEIRDTETAQIAVEAALTGHLLFSTLHTNDASSTIQRLTEMDIEPFMISASLICVCAQRLMRRLCKSCKESYQPTGNEAEILQRAIAFTDSAYRAKQRGCPICDYRGYKGRIGIHEMMTTTEDIVKAINEGREALTIKKIAMADGMYTLHQDSMRKVAAGTSSMEEAIATVPPDMELRLGHVQGWGDPHDEPTAAVSEEARPAPTPAATGGAS